MGKTIHCDNLRACEICGNCIEKKHPWYYCFINSDNFGNIGMPNDCEGFRHLDLEDNSDDDEYDFNPNETVECPRCGNYAYWEGSCYECDNCGWSGITND